MDNGTPESLEVEKLIQISMEIIGQDHVDFSHALLSNKLEDQKLSIEKARSLFDKIPNSHTGKPFLANKIGVILFAIGSPEKAAEYFRRALVLLSDEDREQRAHIESNLFHALLNKESYEAALSYMMQSLELGSDHCNLFDVERYNPIKILGAGGMGVTFLCNDVYEEQEVVVKTLWRDAGGTIKDVFSEALIAKKINDPRVLKIFDIRRHKGNRPYIVMEYFAGIDLHKYVLSHHNATPLDLQEAIHIISEVAKGMSVAHHLDIPIIHRDIKPNNILYNPETKEVKIIDFGIACMLPNAQEITDTVTVNSNNVVAKKMLGTLGYMAPEQQRGDKEIGTRADIFSLGKTFMFLLTAKTPPTENIMAINANIRNVIGEIVGRCLMPEPVERYGTKELIELLETTKNHINQYGYQNENIVNESSDFVPMEVEEAVVAEEAEEFSDDGFDIDDLPRYVGDEMPEPKPNSDNVNYENPKNQENYNNTADNNHSDDLPLGTDSIVIHPDELDNISDNDALSTNNDALNLSISNDGFDSHLVESVVIPQDWDEEEPEQEEPTSHIPETSELYPVQIKENVPIDPMEINPFDSPLEPTVDWENDSLENPLDISNQGWEQNDFQNPLDISNQDVEQNDFQNPLDISNQDWQQNDFENPLEPIDAGINAPEPFATDNFDISDEMKPLANSQMDMQPVREDVKQEFTRESLLANLNLPNGFFIDEETKEIICEKDGALMVYVPGGVFNMGFNSNDVSPGERIEHEVVVASFLIDQCPINWLQYTHFCDATNRKKPIKPCWELDESDPVVNITWEDALAYATWAGKVLPTEAQWEKTAKGGIFFDGDTTKQLKNPNFDRRYPWGNQAPSFNGWKANCQHEPEYGERCTSFVGAYPKGASPYGCLDMAGNVWEWCHDWYDENYYLQSPGTDPQGPRTGNGKVIRGGAWNSEHKFITTTFRSWMETNHWWNVIGFRTVYKL